MHNAVVTIDRRFNGPPESAKGGYACGLVASAIEGCATARVHLPPPLGLQDGEEAVLLDIPDPVSLEEAEAAAKSTWIEITPTRTDEI